MDNDATTGTLTLPERVLAGGTGGLYSEDEAVIIGVMTDPLHSHDAGDGVDMIAAVIDDRFSTVISEARICPANGGSACPVNDASTFTLVTDGVPLTAASAGDRGLDNMFGLDFTGGGIGNPDGGGGNVLGCKHISLGLGLNGLSSAIGTGGTAAAVCGADGSGDSLSTDDSPGCNWNLNHDMAECNDGTLCDGKAFDAIAFSARVLRDNQENVDDVTSTWQVDITTLSFDCERVNRAETRDVALRGVETKHIAVLTRSASGGSVASTGFSVVAKRDTQGDGSPTDEQTHHNNEHDEQTLQTNLIGAGLGVSLVILVVLVVQAVRGNGGAVKANPAESRFTGSRVQPSTLLVPRKMIDYRS